MPGESTIMKRYLVFSGDDYYPCGGMDDFEIDFDNEDEALERASTYDMEGFKWCHVYDTVKREIIFRI